MYVFTTIRAIAAGDLGVSRAWPRPSRQERRRGAAARPERARRSAATGSGERGRYALSSRAATLRRGARSSKSCGSILQLYVVSPATQVDSRAVRRDSWGGRSSGAVRAAPPLDPV